MHQAIFQKCILLWVTLTRLERQPCLSSNSSSCVTSTQHLQSNLKGPGLPVSLPNQDPPHPPPRWNDQPDLPPLTLHFCPELPANTHSCPLSVMHTDKCVHYQQQQTVAWMAGCLSADKAQTLLTWPCRYNSGEDKHWPPATPSQLYICHMLMTSSLWPPTDGSVLEGSRLRNTIFSPSNMSLIPSLWHSLPRVCHLSPPSPAAKHTIWHDEFNYWVI